MIFADIVDLVLTTLSIIFLKRVILIAVLIVLTIVFIVFCSVAIKNDRDYKNLGIKISNFEEKQRKLNTILQQPIIPGYECSNHIFDQLIQKL